MKITSIRARLTFWYTGLFSFTFLLLSGAAYWLLGYSLANDVDASLMGVSKVLVQQVHNSASPFFPSDVDEIFRRFFGFSPMNRYFEMLDPTGRPDTQRMKPHSERIPLTREALRNATKGHHTFETMAGLSPYPVRVLTVPVMKAGRVSNMVQVGMSLEGIYKTRHTFMIILLALFPVCVLLAGGGGWLLARRALAPVDHMRSAAERISAEDLSKRLESKGNGDELDRLANTLNKMLMRLDAGFSQTRRFSADASHELQTPLTILKGELEVSLRSKRSTEEYEQVLTSALEEINRLARLVEGLLLLSRADAGVLRMDSKPIDLAQLIQEVFEQTRILADSQHVAYTLGPLPPVTVKGDYEQLRRLVLNLVDNAIKYSASEGTVTLVLGKNEETASIQVIDTGPGITPEEQNRIFQPFYRAKDSGTRSGRGSGLGLSIAVSIAEAHGGRIEVESTPGKGSIFKVVLPLNSESSNLKCKI